MKHKPGWPIYRRLHRELTKYGYNTFFVHFQILKLEATGIGNIVTATSQFTLVIILTANARSESLHDCMYSIQQTQVPKYMMGKYNKPKVLRYKSTCFIIQTGYVI